MMKAPSPHTKSHILVAQSELHTRLITPVPIVDEGETVELQESRRDDQGNVVPL